MLYRHRERCRQWHHGIVVDGSVVRHFGREDILVGLGLQCCGPETSASDPDEASWVRIEVTDTGPGIRKEDLDRLFEPFFTTKAAGSGLGLAIISGVVERHGGRVDVDTRLGVGTTFSVRLPAAGAKDKRA